MKVEYFLVAKSDYRNFIDTINSYLNLNLSGVRYELVGGVSMGDPTLNSRYMQAMIRISDEL